MLISGYPLALGMSSPDDTSAPHGEVPPSRAIIDAIAAHEDVDVTDVEPPEFDPLYTVVNPEALDELFRNPHDNTAHVAFEYEGYEIVVHSDGRVEVRDPSDEDAPIDHSVDE